MCCLRIGPRPGASMRLGSAQQACGVQLRKATNAERVTLSVCLQSTYRTFAVCGRQFVRSPCASLTANVAQFTDLTLGCGVWSDGRSGDADRRPLYGDDFGGAPCDAACMT